MRLSELPRHPARNPKLEQYATDGDTAARWLMGIDKQDPFKELQEAVVDLGAGNGILGIGALLLGAPRAIFVEELANTMQSGQGVREALSPCPVRRLHFRGALWFGKVVEMIDKIIGKELDIPKSQPESEGFTTPTAREKAHRQVMEPEPESATSPSSPYPRLLSCAAERFPTKTAETAGDETER
eukprot:Skav221023  [mRNA]  locus=scaffold576:21245:37450:- [translate_table: standard]